MIDTLKINNDYAPRGRSHDAADRIAEVAKPILWSLGLELVEVSIAGQHARTVVRIFIDKAGGVTLEDCERAHRSLNPALDVADPFPHPYTLEISSPGLDRPLRQAGDFRRLHGKRVSLKLKEPHRGQWRVVGRIAGVDEQAVTVMLQDEAGGESLRCEYSRIVRAKQEVEIRRSRQDGADPVG